MDLNLHSLNLDIFIQNLITLFLSINSFISFTVIHVYVDDLLIARYNIFEFFDIKIVLDKKFRINYLATLKCFLGYMVSRSSQGIPPYQRKYILDLLQEVCLLCYKPTSTPIGIGNKLTNTYGTLLSNHTSFKI